MKKRSKYSYAILRYVHDVATSEFVNIGVAVHCAEHGFFEASFRSTSGRIAEFFPDLNTVAFRALAKTMSSRFASLASAYSTPLDFGDKAPNLEALLTSVLPKDDSALVWSPIATGLTTDPRKTLADLFARYVSHYDHKPSIHKRTDGEIQRRFSLALENRQISKFFVEKTIHGQDDEIRFESAWKNGVWHCVESISFDLGAPETIREKAHKYLGQLTSISDSAEPFKVYLILGKPTNSTLLPAYNQAVQILHKIKAEREIVAEADTEQLVERFQHQIAADTCFAHH